MIPANAERIEWAGGPLFSDRVLTRPPYSAGETGTGPPCKAARCPPELPSSCERVLLLGPHSHQRRGRWGRLFQVTRHHPLISFEAECEARPQAGRRLRLWRLELIEHECNSLDSFRTVGGLVSPDPADLPWLPPWAAPNGWNYWGRPWTYLDAPSGHKVVRVSSTLSPPSTRVTMAVLVDCPHEPQFLLDMVVTQSASGAVGRITRQARPLDNMALETAAKWLLPRNYGDIYSIAILEQLKAWEAFRMLNIG